MKLRYSVDQAECFRRGIDCPKSIQTLEVNPADLTEDIRKLIADRLDGIDVFQVHVIGGSRNGLKDKHVVAKVPGFDAFIEACKADEEKVAAEIEDYPKRQEAWAEANRRKSELEKQRHAEERELRNELYKKTKP